jgi:flagellar P-ring protein precursor FlgI
MRNAVILTISLLALLMSRPVPASGAARLKELVTIEGVRDNQLIGYGLVVGLNKTGDRLQTIFSAQSLTNLLQRMGVSVPPDAIRVNNTASVMVTATLPPFAQPGTRIDATAAAIGDASSLQGGLLLLTSLRASDGQTYAVVQGPVVTGGFVAGRTGTSATVNHPTVGRVPNGAIVEQEAPSVAPSETVRLQLRNADYTTAARISEVINERFGSGSGDLLAVAESSAVVNVNLPPSYAKRPPAFIAEMEGLEVEADRTSRVVINERTGTIVMGKLVKISPVVVLHGNLTVEIETGFVVSQPAPFSEQGQTAVVPEVNVGIREEQARNIVLPEGATVEQLVRALMAIGSTPRDIIAILQNVRAAGALEADLEVI